MGQSSIRWNPQRPRKVASSPYCPESALVTSGVKFKLVQELGNAWTLRFGPLSAAEVAVALRAFVH